jgi:hypothetical protein
MPFISRHRCHSTWLNDVLLPSVALQAGALWQAVQAVVFSAVTAAPYFAYMLFGYRQFCTGRV